jgi:hypothetical protein
MYLLYPAKKLYLDTIWLNIMRAISSQIFKIFDDLAEYTNPSPQRPYFVKQKPYEFSSYPKSMFYSPLF